MKTIKLISILLAVLMLVGSLTILVSADGGASTPKYSTNTGDGNSLMMPDPNNEGQYLYREGKYVDADGNVKVVSTPEEKIALMDFRYSDGEYEIYVDAYSGEVAYRNAKTGDVLFTNPYNIGSSKANATEGSSKDELLSQVIVNYTKISDETTARFYSYTWAAIRNQIKVKNIKGGIRVEYTLGREENRSLLPRRVEASVMENIFETIEKNMNAAIESGEIPAEDAADERHRLTQLKAYYTRVSLDDAIDPKTGVRDEIRYNQLCNDYDGILKKFEELSKTNPEYEHFAIYVVDNNLVGEVVIKKQESVIKDYCKDYTFEQLEKDHAFVEYEAETEHFPLFKLALEYTLDKDENGNVGLVVRLPANGIRFDETVYRLDSIDILPYMGAGMNPNEGYTFFPDGSGTLFSFEDIARKGKKEQVTSKVFGQDYAYHEITGMYEEVIRYPVFGVYEKQHISATETRDRGYVAVIEEGESLVQLSSYHGGETSEYNTIIMSVLPRPTDSYNLADAISVGQNSKWTVVSSRKYTGSYTVRYTLLTDKDIIEEQGLTKNVYEASYVGMAKAYRDHLVANKMLTSIQENEIDPENIPLYIETFGAVETTERFLSVPINVMTPLTSFADIKTMYTQLSGVGVTNVNFVMTGFTDGGMIGKQVPYNLKWENAVSKEMSFEELTADAKDKGYGLYPDFDFVFSSNDTLFDGLWLNYHAAKTIDDRYTSKREYSATKHTYVSYYELALSSAYYSYFYEKFVPKYKEYAPIGISVGSLGSYLNSDFDEDEPYNRADSQQYTVEAFEYIDQSLPETKILTSGGNSYCWKFVDHITDIALDSSRFSSSSASVPFLGIVLHGYVEIAGTPINMEGNLDYAFLKAMESGAALKFILSYRNTSELKEFETLSKYYSVNYEIWYNNGDGDLVKLYKELNEVLKGVQTSTIEEHSFISKYAIRVPDADELELDAEQAIADSIAYEKALANAKNEEQRAAIFNARKLIIDAEKTILSATDRTIFGSNDSEYLTKLENNLKELKQIYDSVTNTGSYKELADATQAALDAYSAYQLMHGILTDGLSEVSIDIDSILTAKEAAAADPSKQAAYDEWFAKAVKYLGMGDEAKAIAIISDAEAVKNAKIALDGATDANKAELQSAYDAAKAKFDSYGLLGKVVSASDAIQAMNTLNAAKDAYEKDMNNATLKAEFEAARKAAFGYYTEVGADGKTVAKIVSGSLLDGMTTQVLFESVYGEKNYIGGTRGYRATTKAVFIEKSNALDSALQELYDAADRLVLDDTYEIFVEFVNKYETYKDLVDAVEAAYNYLEGEGVFSSTERDDHLKAIVDELKKIETANEFNAIMAMYNTARDIVDNAYTMYSDIEADYEYHKTADKVAGTHYEIYESDITKLFNGNKYYGFKEQLANSSNNTADNGVVTVTKPVPNTEKYKTDDNMVVYERFSNGTEFILNFNDYSVVVTVNGKVYQLGAYGYIVLTKNA